MFKRVESDGTVSHIEWGIKGKSQLPWFLIHRVWELDGKVVFATIIWEWWPKWDQRRHGIGL